ncbi:MAG: hypothetical protein HWN68_11935 [Desulfobacterales bacterium]|nr:hypothetical protein [Desulfobacterales bacterium]
MFIVTSTEGGSEQVCAKIALDRTKNVISIWNPVDTDGLVHNSPGTCPTEGDCGDVNPRYNLGLGVKVQ